MRKCKTAATKYMYKMWDNSRKTELQCF